MRHVFLDEIILSALQRTVAVAADSPCMRFVRRRHSVVFQQLMVSIASLALSALTSTCIVLTTVDIITEHHGGLY